MFALLLTLLGLSAQAQGSYLLGAITSHYNSKADHLYSGQVSRGLILNPTIGIQKQKSVLFLGMNSINKPMLGGYQKLNYGIVVGAYTQDTSEFKKKNIDFAIQSDIIPIVGLDLSFMWGGIIFTPVNASLYWRL